MDAHGDRINGVATGALLHTFLRSFFLQGSFSAKHRQSIGFLYCMEPVLRAIWHDQDNYRQSLIRHRENYNGNPFMTTLVFGAVANMELRLRDGEGVTEEDIRRFKMIIGPATGSAGDRLFWSTLRPFALLAGITTALVYGFWGALVFIALYNLPVCYLKFRWLFAGYRLGPKVVIEIRNDLIDRAVHFLGIAGSVLAGFTAITITRIAGINGIISGTGVAGSVLVFFASVLLLKKNVPLHFMLVNASLFAICLGFITYYYL